MVGRGILYLVTDCGNINFPVDVCRFNIEHLDVDSMPIVLGVAGWLQAWQTKAMCVDVIGR